ncbi:ECF transporter S component [Lactobacillus sp. ESL0679]|uniref:ECF transporter S component n=1 Tax=Lactobacillus sp. ESL0679 TaxID=2983209 RepID=UPI0032AF7DA1
MKSKSTSNLALLIACAMFGAVAFVIIKFTGIPILPNATFLKFDFSDVIITIGMFLFGVWPGVFIAIIRMLLSLIYSGFSLPSVVGQLAALLASISFALPFYFVTRNMKHDETSGMKRHVKPIIGLICGTIAMAVVLATLNALILTPMYAVTMIPKLPAIHGYSGLLGFTEKVYLGQMLHIPSMGAYIFGIIVPFNLVKGLINSVVVYLLFEAVLRNLKPFVQKNFNLKR